MEEIKAEADRKKKKLAESQQLVPRSFREKQAKEARKKYKATIIRIQFPDEVILQGVFGPWERTTALYEVNTFYPLKYFFSIFNMNFEFTRTSYI